MMNMQQTVLKLIIIGGRSYLWNFYPLYLYSIAFSIHVVHVNYNSKSALIYILSPHMSALVGKTSMRIKP